MIKQFLLSIWKVVIRIFAFFGKEIRGIWHQPRLLVTLILGPFLILLLFGAGYRNESRKLNTLIVVPEESEFLSYIDQFRESLDERVIDAQITHDSVDANFRLINQEVDALIIVPLNPRAEWENDEKAEIIVKHNEIDPVEAGYIQYISQQLVDEINQEILLEVVVESQRGAAEWHNEVAAAREETASLQEAFANGNTAEAQQTAQSLKNRLDLVTLILGSGVVMATGRQGGGTQGDVITPIMAELETLQAQTDELIELTGDGSDLAAGEATATEMVASLEEVETSLGDFQELDASILVSPFRSVTQGITETRIEPMHYYVPAVIALLLQHLAITLSGLSIIKEKLGGALELFRAAPVSAFEVLTGKYSSYLVIIGFLFAILTGLLIWGLQVPQLGTWRSYILVILAVLFASLGIGFHISLSARSDSQAIQLGMLTLLAAIFFSGFFLPLYRLAPAVRVVSWLLPATYGTAMLQNVMLRGQPPQWYLLIGLFAFSIILYLFAWVRLHRRMRLA